MPAPELLLLLGLPSVLALWLLRPLPVLSDTRFTGGLLAASVLVPAAWGSLLPQGRARLAAWRTVSALAAALVAVLAGELLARAMMPRLVFDPRFRLRPHMSYRIEVDLPGVSHGGTVTTNRWGLRGGEPPGNWEEATTVLAVGGSTTVNFYLGDSLTWPAVAERELRGEWPDLWIGNGGVPAQSAATHDIFLREVVAPIGPDYVLFLVGANDMDVFLREGGGPEVLPELGPRAWLYGHSRLYQALYTAKKVLLDDAEVVRETTDPPFSPRPIDASAPLPDDLHAAMHDPGEYRRRIRRLIRTSREIGVVPVFLTQPLLYSDTPEWRSVAGGSRWDGTRELPVSAADYARMVGALNGDLIAVCEEEGVHCFDLASRVPPQSTYFYDAMHFTEAGADLVGRLVAGYLAEEVLPGPEPR
jgi:lysophospholipase L1-like esterase